MHLRRNKRSAVNDAPADGRPPKRARGRPKTSQPDAAGTIDKERNSARPTSARSEEPEATAPKRRGRPKGSRSSTDTQATVVAEVKTQRDNNAQVEDKEQSIMSNEELDSLQNASKSSNPPKTAAKRGRRKASDTAKVVTDGAFEYTPRASRQIKSPVMPKPQVAPAVRGQKAKSEEDNVIPETQKVSAPEVDESIIDDKLASAPHAPTSPTKSSFDTLASQRDVQYSPSKRRSGVAQGEEKPSGEVEMKRKFDDLTKRYDALEKVYRNLREVGIVEANANVDKMRKQCEAITKASNELVASLKAELVTEKALGQQARALQRQLKDRDTKVAQLESRSDELTGQLSSAQSEVKALQTKLAAARNTAASIESAAAKVPGSAIKKNAANRLNTAASAEAAQAAQIAQLKEDLYSDLTGLIIRDVKKRESDSLYDCIQTGANGTLHFKLAVPHVSVANFESAEFQYIPFLDENRDRDLIDILPEYLTVDITFSRRQASNFYTRVMDALTKPPAESDD